VAKPSVKVIATMNDFLMTIPRSKVYEAAPGLRLSYERAIDFKDNFA
jgi:hypothetical protein